MKSLSTFKSIDWIILLGLGLFLVFTPSSDIVSLPHLYLHDNKRSIEILLICICFVSALFNENFRHGTLQQICLFPLKVHIILPIIFLLSLLSSFLSPLPEQALLEASLYTGLFFFTVTISSVSSRYNLFQEFLLTITILTSLCYQTNFFAAYLASFIEDLPLVWQEPFSGFANVRFFNQYQLWLFFLVSLPLLIYPKLDARLSWSIKIIATGWGALLFSSGSRGAILAIILSLIITFVIFKKKALTFIKLNTIVLFLGFIGSRLLFQLIPYLLNSKVVLGWKSIDKLATDNIRLIHWETALAHIQNSPLLGIGPMHYAYYGDPYAAHPHNSFLQWGAEMGLPSLILVLFLIGGGMLAWVKRCHELLQTEPQKLEADKHLYIALFTTMSAGLIYSLVSGVIVMPMSQILMMTVGGWMIGLYFKDKKRPEVKPQANILSMLFIGGVLITFTYTIMPSFAPRLAGLDIDELATRQHIDKRGNQHPRFWQQGEIPH